MATEYEPYIRDEQLFETVRIGQEAQLYMESDPMGTLLYKKALLQYRTAVADFEELDNKKIISSPEIVVEIKQRMSVARAFVEWVEATVAAGKSAERELHARDTQDFVED